MCGWVVPSVQTCIFEFLKWFFSVTSVFSLRIFVTVDLDSIEACGADVARAPIWACLPLRRVPLSVRVFLFVAVAAMLVLSIVIFALYMKRVFVRKTSRTVHMKRKGE